jgi:hypothetical protein
MKDTVLVSQAWRRDPWYGIRLLVVRILLKFHKHLGERGIQWSPLVIFQILLDLLILPGTVVLRGLGLLLFLGLFRGGLLWLLRSTEKGSECFLLVNIPVYLYHKGVKILRWFQRQISHQRSIFFQPLKN